MTVGGDQVIVGGDQVKEKPVRRRTVLVGIAGVAGSAGGAVSVVSASPASASSAGSAVPAARVVGRAAPLLTVPVQGTDLTVALRPGPVATILVHVVRRFHYEIESLRAGDLVADRSGTAVHIRPGAYPAGVSGGFLPHQMVVIRDLVASADGLVRWGGDLGVPVEGRFEIAARVSDPRLAALAERLVRGPGPGADMAMPFTPARQKTADIVRRQMR
jgi:hypothetical protein